MAEGRPRQPKARRRPGAARQDGAASGAVRADRRQRRAGRHRGLCDGRRGRRRHPQPDLLHSPRSGGLVLRPAPARPRAARPLRPADRRLARRHGPAQDRRRRRRHGRRRQPADREARRLLRRAGPARRRRQGDGRFRHPAVQRHRARHGGRLDPRGRRPCRGRRDRPRPGRGDRRPAALHGPWRPRDAASRRRQHRRSGRRIRPGGRRQRRGRDRQRPARRADARARPAHRRLRSADRRRARRRRHQGLARPFGRPRRRPGFCRCPSGRPPCRSPRARW